MNHTPSDDSTNVPNSGQAVVAGKTPSPDTERPDRLNPLVQSALNNLDIKLEDELIRFRSASTNPEAAGTDPVEVIWEQQATDADDSEILTAEIVRSAIARSHPNDSGSAFIDADTPSGGFIVIDGLATATMTDRYAAEANYRSISLPQEQTNRENLDLNFATAGEITTIEGEYTSSSQELLRQIQSGYTAGNSTQSGTQTPSAAPKPKLFTPVKIGSFAAACVMAGGATYTYLNPSVLAPLTATKTVAPTVATTSNSLGQAIQSPNLAASEFTDLSNLSAINTIKLPTTAAPNVGIAPAPATIATPTGTMNVAPAAVPFNSVGTRLAPPATIVSQPRLADSLVRSLLPPNFHAPTQQPAQRAVPPTVR